eukprot:4999533-Prymnesium_polylepis.1
MYTGRSATLTLSPRKRWICRIRSARASGSVAASAHGSPSGSHRWTVIVASMYVRSCTGVSMSRSASASSASILARLSFANLMRTRGFVETANCCRSTSERLYSSTRRSCRL